MKKKTRRHQVIIQTPVDVDDGGGGKERSWKDGATVWAAVEPLVGREAVQSGQLQAQVSHRVTMRYRRDVTAEHQLRFGGRTLTITSVANVEERNIDLELLCQEVVGQ